MQLLPFTKTFAPEEQDKNLTAKLKAELPGILNWAIEGCRLWQKFGLKMPPVMQKEVGAYRSEMDVVGQWLDECCDLTVGGKVTVKDAYQSYSNWCRTNGCASLSSRRFYQKLDERGFTTTRSGHARYRVGFTLLQPVIFDRG